MILSFGVALWDLMIKGNEIRQQFVYFGTMDKVDFINSDEGELYWIDQNELLNLHMLRINKNMIEQYFDNTNLGGVIIGTITIIV